jgi:hypothetical protein
MSKGSTSFSAKIIPNYSTSFPAQVSMTNSASLLSPPSRLKSEPCNNIPNKVEMHNYQSNGTLLRINNPKNVNERKITLSVAANFALG